MALTKGIFLGMNKDHSNGELLSGQGVWKIFSMAYNANS